MPKPCVAAAVGLALSSAAFASSPITLYYAVQPLDGGMFRYSFTLKADNFDGTWEPGQGFGWVVLGDGHGADSPLSDLTGDPMSLPVGPWDRYSYTAGYNNGPSLGREREEWFPRFLGDSISWTGISSTELPAGALRWSSLVTYGRNGPIEYEVAHLVAACGPADVDLDGYVSGDDLDAFLLMFDAGSSAADVDASGFVNGDDWFAFFESFQMGC